MHLKLVVDLLRLLSSLAVTALGAGWMTLSGVQASMAIAPQSIHKAAPSSTLVLDAIAPKNNSNSDDDARDENPEKQDREG